MVFGDTRIEDDPKLGIPFKEGTISFAGSEQHSRTSQLFISYTSMNEHFGEMDWETPLGTVIKGMDVVKNFYSGYGDMPPYGNGPTQQKIRAYGKDYIRDLYSKIDEFMECTVSRSIG